MALLQREFNWQDVTIQMMGKVVAGARAVKYTAKCDQINVYALGGKPIAIATGKKEFEAELTIIQSELEALQRSLPAGKSILDIQAFDVVVVYENDGLLVTDILKNCRFTEVTKEIKVDDPFMEITLPIAVMDIQYNV